MLCVLIVVAEIVWLRYQYMRDHEMQLLSEALHAQSAGVSAIVNRTTDALTLLRTQARSWYKTHPAQFTESALHAALRSSRTPSGFVNLDTLPERWSWAETGNLTGYPGPPSPSLDREVEMALSLAGTFPGVCSSIPDVTWIYYTSARRFIDIYPWVPVRDFRYSDTARKQSFYVEVEPQNNPSARIVWTPAYIDEAGQGAMVTASAGIFEGDTFRGAIALDVTLNRLNAFVGAWPFALGTLFIVNDEGQLLAHPTLVQRNASRILSMTAAFPSGFSGRLPALLSRSRGHFILDQGYYLQNFPIEDTPFRLVLLFSSTDLLRQVLLNGVLTVTGLMAAMIAMLLVARNLAHRHAIKPAEKLVRYIEEESRGAAVKMPDVPAAWRPWFSTIRDVFNAHVRLVSIKQELDVARRMQRTIVPTRFPSRVEVQMYGCMLAAQEVGGDFYDYFWLDEKHVGVVIADVSGKGVPAALFMAVARTLLRAIAPAATSTGACLAMTNDFLCQDNEAAMFVTLFYGILNIDTGKLMYSNAGHNPPYIVGQDGTLTRLAPTGDTALGVADGLEYSQHETWLTAGSTLVLYTDGVTETFNTVGEAFGETRLAAQLAHTHNMPVRPLLDALVEIVHRFADGAPQSDDLTCLAVHFDSADSLRPATSDG